MVLLLSDARLRFPCSAASSSEHRSCDFNAILLKSILKLAGNDTTPQQQPIMCISNKLTLISQVDWSLYFTVIRKKIVRRFPLTSSVGFAHSIAVPDICKCFKR